MTEPEIDAKLIDQAAEAWERRNDLPDEDYITWYNWLISELRAAATVAVEQLEPELADLRKQLANWQSIAANREANRSCGGCGKEYPASQDFCPGCYRNYIEDDPQATSGLRERPLAGGGMTVEERWDGFENAWFAAADRPMRRKAFEQAVAEAVAAERADHENSWVKKSVLEAANRHHATDAAKLTEANQGLLQELALLKERHAQELQEALAAERDRFNKSWDVRTGRNQEAFKEQEERHAAELAQVKAELAQQYQEQSDNDQRWQSRLTEERANWQAQMAKNRKSHNEEVAELRDVIKRELRIKQTDVQQATEFANENAAKAVAAAYEECAKIADDVAKDWNSSAGMEVAFKIRERAAEPQEEGNGPEPGEILKVYEDVPCQCGRAVICPRHQSVDPYFGQTTVSDSPAQGQPGNYKWTDPDPLGFYSLTVGLHSCAATSA